MNHSFDAVLRAAKDGQEWAWEAVYHSIAPTLTGYLASRGAKEPEDLASETLLQIARGIYAFEGSEEAFRSWVFVIGHRRLIDSRRKEERSVQTAPLPDEVDVSGGNVENEALDRVALAEIHRLLEPLTEDQRSVIALRVIADLSLDETAKVLGKRVGAVKALQRRALSSLKRDLTPKVVSPSGQQTITSVT